MLNLITGGSATVLINGKRAARLGDATAHGGLITSGSPKVLIGDYTARAATKVFPGQQSFGNCGLMSCQQIIRQATGQYWDETDFLNNAITDGFADYSVRYDRLGGMLFKQERNLLNALGVPSAGRHFSNLVLPKGSRSFTDAELREKAKKSLTKALGDKKGVVAIVDPGKLWNNLNHIGENHAIVLTEGVFKERNELTHVYINNTGQNRQGRRMTVDEILNAMQRIVSSHTIYSTVTTNKPIWHQPPPPPSPGPTPFPQTVRSSTPAPAPTPYIP